MNKNILLFSLTVLAIVAIPWWSHANSTSLERYTPSKWLSDVIPHYSLSSIIYDAIKKDWLQIYDNSFSVDKEKTIGWNSILVTLPAWLEIYQQDINSDSTMKSVSEFIVTKKGDAYVVWDSKSHLVFSKPVKLEITTKIPNGTLAKIVVKHEWDLGYNTKWLTNDSNTTCTQWVSSNENSFSIVKNNKIVIYTCGASEFKVDIWFSSTTLFNNRVNVIYPQPDGKFIIWGTFTEYNWNTAGRITRLNSDGTIDTWFNVGWIWMVNSSSSVNAIDLQPDGKILVWWQFWEYNGSSVGQIIRLNTDGSRDTSFTPVAPYVNDWINAIRVLSWWKIFIWWYFTPSNSYYSWHIALLNADWSKDTSFVIWTWFDQNVYSIELQWNQIIVWGPFTKYQWQNHPYLVRLNMDGSIDTWFNVAWWFNNGVYHVKVLADNKVLVWWYFTIYSWQSVNRIVRLNSDSSIDTWFYTWPIANNWIASLSVQSDGKILMAFQWYPQSQLHRLNSDGTIDNTFYWGAKFTVCCSPAPLITLPLSWGKILVWWSFQLFSWWEAQNMVWLNSDGTKDYSFPEAKWLNGSILALLPLSDGKILVWGTFTNYNWASQNRLVRIDDQWNADTWFNIWSSFTLVWCCSFGVQSMALQADGKVLVWWDFVWYSWVTQNRITRLNVDWTRDVAFNIWWSGFNSQVRWFYVQPDQKIFVWWYFSNYNWVTVPPFIRLNSDGTRDTSIATWFGGTADWIYIQQDGKILIWWGYSTVFDWVTVLRFTRMNPDGTRDTWFNVWGWVDSSINWLLMQPDQKIILYWYFSTYSGYSQNRITRLNIDGTRDTWFNVGWWFNSPYVYSAKLQSDGKILVAWWFTAYNWQTTNRIVRLNTNGTLDTWFNIWWWFNNEVRWLYIQADGKILVWWAFTWFNWQTVNRIARLNTNGTLDTSLNIWLWFNNDLIQVWVQNNKVIAYGQFGSYNWIPTRRFTRLYATTPVQPVIIIPGSWSTTSIGGNVVVTGTWEANQEIRIEVWNNTYTWSITSTWAWNFSLTWLTSGTYILTGKVYDWLSHVSTGTTVIFTVPSPVVWLDVQVFPNTQWVVQWWTWFLSITMTNTGNIWLTGLSVTNIMIPMCDRMIWYLGAWETTWYSCSVFPVNAGFTNSTHIVWTWWYNGGEVTWQSISQSINSTVMISPVNIDLNVTMTPSTQTLRFGWWATFTVTVINSWDVDMEWVTVLNSNVWSCNTIIWYLWVNEATQYICSQLVTWSYTNTINVTGYVSTWWFQYPNLIWASQTSVDVVYNPPVVWDGIIEWTEQCEDWNTNNNDGCNSNGQIETPTCVLTWVVSSLQVNVQWVTANWGIFTDIDRWNWLTWVVHSTTLFENNIYAAAWTYNIKWVVESIYSSSITWECMVYNIVATPAVWFGWGWASAWWNNWWWWSTVATQPKPQEIKEIVPIKFIDTSKPETSLVLIWTVQDNVIQQEIVINPEDITTEIRQTKWSQDIPVQVATVNMQSHNTGIQWNTTTQQVVIIPSDTLLTNKYTLVVAAQAYWWVIYGWETAIVPIQVNKLLQEEKNCYTPQNNVAVTLWTWTKQKDQLIYQALLQAYWLTRFTDTDSFKPLNGLKRYEAAKMLVEFARNVLCREKIKIFDNQYNDIATVDPTLKPYIIEAFEFGILKWSNGRFNPLETITKKEFVAAVMRMFTNENMDVEWAWNNWDQEYVTLFNELKLDRELWIWNTIERYDVSKILYKLYHNDTYEYGEAWYYIPSENIWDR